MMNIMIMMMNIMMMMTSPSISRRKAERNWSIERGSLALFSCMFGLQTPCSQYLLSRSRSPFSLYSRSISLNLFFCLELVGKARPYPVMADQLPTLENKVSCCWSLLTQVEFL